MNFLRIIGVVGLLTSSMIWSFKQADVDMFLKTKQGKGLDFSGANLVGADLSRGNLDGANLEGATLDEADLSYSSLQNANMKNVKARGVNMCYTNASGADFSNADLSSLVVTSQQTVTETVPAADSRGGRTKPTRTPTVATSQAQQPKTITKTINSSVSKNTRLSYAKFTGANMFSVNLVNADLNYTDLSNTRWNPDTKPIRGATLVHANLKGVKGPLDTTGAINVQTSMAALPQ